MIEPDDTSAARAAYDTVAVDYDELLRDELAGKPHDRAQLAAFAELVQADGNGSVADIGCGPGRITAHLHDLGLQVFGIDLSPEMIAVARQAHPSLQFLEGTMEALDLADDTLGGIVAWYSIIHTPPERLPLVFAEFARVLVAGGYLLLAFQAGDEPRHLAHAYGHDIDLMAYRLPPDRIVDLLAAAGLAVQSQLVRAPDQSEKTPQAFLLARKR
ncbi:Methyltransferase domain-containing protein [Cryobacterium flavum]|uniref:Class I SAM-dependent methyltransferase n=1 Tax=Cryobacterium flavum TaxID=1424659 RepID=A0A4V3I849_9MICO|nr:MULTISPECIES: class I SAM-dependent methyltransferase [Cryobacterium]TFB72897.1 class I SAM-dependent methyltransferase [Cryobacterium flavum]SDO44454.1 Methyltransferase domain-containing protein [Cryobacterium flavum]